MVYVYDFSQGSKEMKSLLGGKGANLAEMTKIGLPVPPGFTVTTEACVKYYKDDLKIDNSIIEEIKQHMCSLENALGKKFGSDANPLLVSVRSGSVFSMPGMMDTILNLGLNDKTVNALAVTTNNERFAYDSYRRFIQMFSDVVFSVHKYKFDRIMEDVKTRNNYSTDQELTVEDLKEIVERFKALFEKEVGESFPQDPFKQLVLAVQAVFDSWNNPRAILYRDLNDIDHNLGTAVNIQSMVFGNMGETSGTGVAFTRNPSTGEKELFGEYLINAQGEDVVAGIRTPQHISTLEEVMPDIFKQFKDITVILENHYKDMQDIEFTIENGKLYMLQTRNGKRTAHAGVKIAVDLVEEGVITKEEAIMTVEPNQLNHLLHPTFNQDDLTNMKVVATGLPASPGAASGRVYFSSSEAVNRAKNGEKVILVRPETSPEDIEGMLLAEGTLTSRGGMTSHASVVARGMGKCCIAGCSDINIDEHKNKMIIGDIVIHEGDIISLDGSTGNVYLGEIKKSDVLMDSNFTKFMNLVDSVKDIDVRANADNKQDAEIAVKFGAAGIGLCRTEHMFFDEDRIPVMRQMILSANDKERQIYLDRLMQMQISDFTELFEVMGERNINIRLLDPPLHEFLPKNPIAIRELAFSMKLNVAEMNKRIESLHEFNPMLGHRGCRLLITYPEIAVMQAKAIIYGAINVYKKGVIVKPEIMIPLVGDKKELSYLKEHINEAVASVLSSENVELEYQIGTMIETPRACVVADEIAEDADFFSFGTNDLTQMTFGYSRDDSPKFIEDYKNKKLIEKDPFETLDINGVGKMVKTGLTLGRSTKPNLKIGICGEHGGDPSSIEFFHSLGFNYVSCSPYRVPIARLAAAQATVKNKK